MSRSGLTRNDTSPPSGSPTTHFGFRTVNRSDKADMVHDVFNSVAPKYDLMNDLMSGGIHRLWKNALIGHLRPTPDMRLLDVGGGTGDIAFRFLNKGGGHVTVIDSNEDMLAAGRDRAINKGILENIEWLPGDAENLPVGSAVADVYTIAFCIRNVTNMERVLADARRVLKPGGHFLCLEFSTVSLPWLSRLYDAYSFRVLPRLGSMVASDADSYQYLAESIRQFPDAKAFAAMIEEAGLRNVTCHTLSGGIAAIHSGWRI